MRTIDAIRRRFPALAGDWHLLENAGGSQVPETVPDAIRDYMRGTYVQLGAGYPLSRRADEVVARTHALSRVFVGDPGVGAAAGTAILGPSTSQLCAMLADAYGRTIRAGDNVVVADTGHEANVGPWTRLAARGIEVRHWSVNRDAQDCLLPDLDAVLDARTRIVAVPHVSNLLGAVADVAEIGRRAHAVGARVVVDGVAFAPHRAVDVAALGADWYVFSTYKVYGPHMAVLWGRADAAAEIEGPNHFFVPRGEHPYKFELGGVPHESCAGWNAAIEYVAWLGGHSGAGDFGREAIVSGFAEAARLEAPLVERLLDGLRSLSGVRVIGPAVSGPTRVPTVSFTHARLSSRDVVAAMHARRVAVRNGHMYAHRLCTALGIDLADGVVRISAVHYNTADEVDAAIAAIPS
ncbi:MAG: aminotransferase class V-fold PLP-dependent enzyme [Planctomycetes bacterium]|nr:aminotransferase class V-fold PLP-dependent enzyme [Planctomycetota bacterium]